MGPGTRSRTRTTEVESNLLGDQDSDQEQSLPDLDGHDAQDNQGVPVISTNEDLLRILEERDSMWERRLADLETRFQRSHRTTMDTDELLTLEMRKAHVSRIVQPLDPKKVDSNIIAFGAFRVQILRGSENYNEWKSEIDKLLLSQEIDIDNVVANMNLDPGDPLTNIKFEKVNQVLNWTVSPKLRKDYEALFKRADPSATLKALANLAVDECVTAEDYTRQIMELNFKANEDPSTFLQRAGTLFVNANLAGCSFPETFFWYQVKAADKANVFESYRLLVDREHGLDQPLALKITRIASAMATYKASGSRSSHQAIACVTNSKPKQDKKWVKPSGKYCLRCGRSGKSFHETKACYAKSPLPGYNPPGGFNSMPPAPERTSRSKDETNLIVPDVAFNFTTSINCPADPGPSASRAEDQILEDSGACSMIFNNLKWFSDLRPANPIIESTEVFVGDGSPLSIKGYGTVLFQCRSHSGKYIYVCIPQVPVRSRNEA